MALTTLTRESVKGKKRATIAREIIQQVGPDVEVPDVIKEVKRLCGEDIMNTAVYTLRKEIRDNANGEASSNGTSHKPSEPIPAPLSEVETFFKVRAFVKEIGGVEKMKAYLAMVEKDEAVKA